MSFRRPHGRHGNTPLRAVVCYNPPPHHPAALLILLEPPVTYNHLHAAVSFNHLCSLRPLVRTPLFAAETVDAIWYLTRKVGVEVIQNSPWLVAVMQKHIQQDLVAVPCHGPRARKAAEASGRRWKAAEGGRRR